MDDSLSLFSKQANLTNRRQELGKRKPSIMGSLNNTFAQSQRSFFHENLEIRVFSIFTAVVCIFGLVGNAIVIWLLGFGMKKNPFTTYILNLAVSDFGVLLSFLSIIPLFITENFFSKTVLYCISTELFQFTYSTSQFLLTAISMDRCVALLFPVWYRFHRRRSSPTLVCALMWFLSLLITAVLCIFNCTEIIRSNFRVHYQLMVNAVLCPPLMIISSLILFVKVCVTSQQHLHRKVLMVLLLSLLFFLLFALPLNVLYIVHDLCGYPSYVEYCGFLFACLNSSINPIIYFLVGRQRNCQSNKSMKVILQRIFGEEEHQEKETVSTLQTQM
ncbi:mas-related G-protein coupled receptor member H-like [Eublepharis macularius]|uniref:Mas-related G-protein coupled receptor member H-like n=1 Tax=Eublepharis macularius TaxID=481883 RepID=A0AA97JMS7_EUBMA|nr:mas-related G-protein coupled receptor member H-like [Eublepharis macularius]